METEVHGSMLNNIFIFTYTQIKNKQIECKEEGFKFVNNIDTWVWTQLYKEEVDSNFIWIKIYELLSNLSMDSV